MPAENVKQIIEMKEYLLRKFSKRNETFQALREMYNSEEWNGTEVQGIKLIYNLCAAAVDRYTDFLIQPPDWQVIPAGTEKKDLDLADRMEKFLYMQYELNDIEIAQAWMANNQSMLGMFAVEVLPEFKSKERIVKIQVPIPEYVYPLPKSDNILDLDAVIILSDSYSYYENPEHFQPDTRHDQKIRSANTIKYYDANKIVVVKDNQETLRIQHDFGFIPVIIGQNRVRPHVIEGVSDLEQAAGLQRYLNDLLSWNADIMEYHANPMTIFKGVAEIPKETGPGARAALPTGASAEFLLWPGQAPTVENMINRIQQAIEDLTFLGDPLFARNIPSGTSGSAVRSLLSGIQAAFLRKQMTMGVVYKKLNEVILRIAEKEFAGQELLIRGTKKNNNFITKLKGSEIGGNYRTRVIWPPSILDQPTRIDLELTKMNSRVQSKYTTMENIGIQSPQDEQKIIDQEQEIELEREITKANPGLPLGLDRQKQAEIEQASRGLDQMGAQSGGSEEQMLIQAIASTQKIRGDVLFGGREGNNFVIILTDPKDKSTILNRVPQKFKGRIKFKTFDENTDSELPVIVEQGAQDAARA